MDSLFFTYSSYCTKRLSVRADNYSVQQTILPFILSLLWSFPSSQISNHLNLSTSSCLHPSLPWGMQIHKIANIYHFPALLRLNKNQACLVVLSKSICKEN